MTANPHEFDAEGRLPDDHDPHAEGGQAVAWQDDQPPHDDFGDPQDGGAAEAHAEGDHDSQASAADQAAGKRRGKLVLLGALAVIAVFAGGMAYLQLGSGGSSSMGAPPPVASNPPPAGTNTASADMPSAPTTGEADLTAIYNAGRDTPVSGTAAMPDATPPGGTPAGTVTSDITTTTASAPADLLASANPAPVPAPAAAPQPAVQVQQPTAVVPVPVPVPSSAPMPVQSGTPDLVPPVAQPEAVPVPQAAQGTLDARLNALTAQIQMLQHSLEQTTQQTNQLAGRLESMPSSSGAGTGLEDRLNRIEQQVSGMTRSKPRYITSESADMGLTASPEPQTMRSSKSAPSSSKNRPSAKASKAKASVSGKAWVLRAATPEAAWVAKDANSDDLRRVQVGDTLAGIGKVRAIRQKGEAWVVVGSKGSLQ